MVCNCIHCGFEIEHTYCPKCGQGKQVSKIDKKFILHDLQHGIFHFDNSFLYTLFALYKQPAVVIKSFIQGKRKRYANPFTLVVFLATLYTIASTHFIVKEPVITFTNNLKKNDFGSIEVIHNYTWVVLIILPILSFLTYTFFKKSGCNYYEILVYECFIQSKILCVNFLFLPVQYFFPHLEFLNTISFLLCGVIALRAKVLFFDQYSWINVVIKTVLTMILTLIVNVILLLIITYVVATFK